MGAIGRLRPPAAGLDPAEFPPPSYIGTIVPGVGEGAACEDRDGSVFQTRFTRGCEKVCSDAREPCSDGPVRCYWQYSFPVTTLALEQGGVFEHAGFSLGNYNYRTESVAINFVGTDLRDCSASTSPASCYASGYLDYSLDHTGPFEVRNHEGEIYKAPLYDGHINWQKGLAAERYLTNPLSVSDTALIGQKPYSRHEFAGRPLTGNYRLRIWDTDGLNISALEDIQVVLGYRYWTRLR